MISLGADQAEGGGIGIGNLLYQDQIEGRNTGADCDLAAVIGIAALVLGIQIGACGEINGGALSGREDRGAGQIDLAAQVVVDTATGALVEDLAAQDRYRSL